MTHSHKVMHSCIHVIVTNCLLSCVLNSKDVTHLLLSSCEFNVYVCMCRWTRWAQSQWDCRESTLTRPIRSMPNRRKWSKTGNSSETRLVLSSVVAPASSVASPFQGLEDGGKKAKGPWRGWGMTHWLQLKWVGVGWGSWGSWERGVRPAGYLLEGVIRARGVWPAGYRLPVREDHKGEGCDPLAQATCQRGHKGEGCDPLAQATCQRGVIRVRGVTCWLQATCQRGS